MLPLVLSAGAFLTVLFPALALVLALRGRIAGAAGRLAGVERLHQELLLSVGPGAAVRTAVQDGKPAPTKSPARSAERALSARFEQTSLGRRVLPKAIRDLEQTPWQFSAFAYLVLRAGLPLGAGVLAWLLLSSPLAAVGAAVVAHVVLQGIVRMQISRYRRTLGRQTEVVIDILVAHLRAGQSLVQSLNALAEEAPSPSREEYERVVRQLALGAPVSEALRRLEERAPVPAISLLVSALNLHHRIGGDLPLLLRIAAETVHDQIRLQDELATAAAGQLLAGYVVVALPIILFLVLMLIDRPYLSGLFHPGWNLLLWLGGIMEFCGFMMMRAFTNVEV